MVILELRWVLLGVVFFLVLASLAGLGLESLRRRRKAQDLLSYEVTRLLEYAPFGFLLLDSPDRYAYANPCARNLLSLEKSSGTLPEEERAFLLDEDRALAREESAPRGQYRLLSLPGDKFARGNAPHQAGTGLRRPEKVLAQPERLGG